MTPYAFEYQRAASVAEAVQLLQQHGMDAKLLAGGHSLIPAMKLRLSAPQVLIDVSGIDELRGIRVEGDRLHIGAGTTHRAVEHSDEVRQHCAVLARTAAHIGDPQVRNRGTLGGSLAHADPSADYPAVVLALGATIHVAGPGGAREIAADDFFQGLFTTALQDGEIITRVSVPALTGGKRAAYAKFANPASRYAIVGVCAMLDVDRGPTVRSARIAVTGATAHAHRARSVEEKLAGQLVNEDTVAEAVAGMADGADLMSDLSASAEYRRHLVEVMTKKAILEAAA
ncbi:MAG: xanthine dehydrogenase family protein subunit M [Rhodothermales bacterium]|nr:xanthine dehydrogenase family protein subunit M [Rhodothermales bacterium]